MPEVRLIDANALKAKLKIGTNTATYSDYCNGYCDARQVDLDAIDAAPTVEAEPVRHGRWKKQNSEIYCTNCKKSKWSESFELMLRGFDFCPKCGAKMDGGAEN